MIDELMIDEQTTGYQARIASLPPAASSLLAMGYRLFCSLLPNPRSLSFRSLVPAFLLPRSHSPSPPESSDLFFSSAPSSADSAVLPAPLLPSTTHRPPPAIRFFTRSIVLLFPAFLFPVYRSLTTNHYPLITAVTPPPRLTTPPLPPASPFAVFPTTNHYSLTTAFLSLVPSDPCSLFFTPPPMQSTPPPHQSRPTPHQSRPTPPCHSVKL